MLRRTIATGLGCLFLVGNVTISAQAVDYRQRGSQQCAVTGCGGGGGGSSSTPTYTPPAVYEPSPAELTQRQVVALQQQGLAQLRQGKFLEARRLFALALNMAVSAADIKNLKRNIADTHQEVGNLAAKRGDIDQALREYELANQNNPGESVILDSLKYLRGEVATRQQAKAAEQQARAAEQAAAQETRASAARMQNSIQELAQSFNAAPSSGGLDFDGRASGTVPGGGSGGSGGLDFIAAVAAPSQAMPASASPSGDPRVVDGRNVPSGLSKPVENAIAVAYQNAPPGVSDRVRKGFQAVADRDWKVAKAWFEDALNRDPDNAALKRMIVLSDYTLSNRPAATPVPARSVPEVPNSTPDKAEIDKFFRDFQAGRHQTPTDKVRTYVLSMPPEQFKRLLWDLQPQDSDIQYLYDLNTPRPARSWFGAR